ncbi:MAG: hypothetical protein LBJ00_11405 [Planctomycetaceae bacterium]|jgi:hypothetical protein|nr:hypothetical protein [Planctomycetaceae bacterium]
MKNKMSVTNVWNKLDNLYSFLALFFVTAVGLVRNKLQNVKIGGGGGAR